MSRNARCILPGLAYHVTQRGTNREKIFFSAAHRKTYLGLLERNCPDAKGDGAVRTLKISIRLNSGCPVRTRSDPTWREMHDSTDGEPQLNLLRRCTYAGRPSGEEEFIGRLENHFQRNWRRCSFETAAAVG